MGMEMRFDREMLERVDAAASAYLDHLHTEAERLECAGFFRSAALVRSEAKALDEALTYCRGFSPA